MNAWWWLCSWFANANACLTPRCYSVQRRHKDVYWFGHERPYVQWVLRLLVLPCSGVLVVRVTSFWERWGSQVSFEGSVAELHGMPGMHRHTLWFRVHSEYIYVSIYKKEKTLVCDSSEREAVLLREQRQATTGVCDHQAHEATRAHGRRPMRPGNGITPRAMPRIGLTWR
jgi:hypothetical protein